MEMKKNDNPNPDDFYEPEQVHKSRRDRRVLGENHFVAIQLAEVT